MSHYMTALAMRQKGLPPATKILLYWIADHHNGETGECFPSINRLVTLCEMSRRSVQNHIDMLEGIGLISVDKNFRDSDGRQTANNYTLHLEGGNICTGEGAKSAQGGVQNLHTNNLGISNLGIDNKKDTKKDLFHDFYEVYPKKKARGAAEKAWEKAIKKTDPEKILAAARDFAQFSQGKDKQFLPYPATWLNQERWDDELEQDTRRTTTDYLNSLFNVDTKGITKQ